VLLSFRPLPSETAGDFREALPGTIVVITSSGRAAARSAMV